MNRKKFISDVVNIDLLEARMLKLGLKAFRKDSNIPDEITDNEILTSNLAELSKRFYKDED